MTYLITGITKLVSALFIAALAGFNFKGADDLGFTRWLVALSVFMTLYIGAAAAVDLILFGQARVAAKKEKRNDE